MKTKVARHTLCSLNHMSDDELVAAHKAAGTGPLADYIDNFLAAMRADRFDCPAFAEGYREKCREIAIANFILVDNDALN